MLGLVTKIDAIRTALAAHRPEALSPPGSSRAAVALVLRERSGEPEALFIKRARHPKDPWSGHMALPGGRVDAGDASVRSAAERETREEVGLDLADAERLGQLDDLEGRHAGRPAGLVISAFVYRHPSPGKLSLNHEVEDALWVPLVQLSEPGRRVEHFHRALQGMAFPGIRVGAAEGHVVWGLTYRFIEQFLEIVGAPIPDRWGALR